ncbi:MAG: ABC transporter permease [Bacteroides sp.]|nr:ABC transporter permease [Bacteroides sp.]
MSQLQILIAQEYKTDIRAKSFWITTLLFPLLTIGFGIFIGLMATESDSLSSVMDTLGGGADEKELSAAQGVAMMIGMFLTLFVMSYGAMIFNKVKIEKTSRIMEVLATCVTGRTMMMAKIIAVGMIGLTQMAVWAFCIIGVAFGVVMLFHVPIPLDEIFSLFVLRAIIWGILFFIGGYVFYGSLFAAVGAMTDKNNENQEYVSLLTFTLLGSFYIGMYAVDHPFTVLSQACSYIPFTAATCGSVGAISGEIPFWQSALSLLLLLGFAYYSVVFAGKLYTSSLLLKGKKFSPKDLIVFFRSK